MTPEHQLPPAFFEARKSGHKAEQRVRLHLLANRAIVQQRNAGRPTDLDVYFGNRSFLVEVKNEDNYADSGRLCLELSQGPIERPSGLATSEAQITIHTLGLKAALYRTQHLRLWLKEHMTTRGIHPRPFGRADFQNKGIVLPIREVQSQAWFELVTFTDLHKSRVWTFGEPEPDANRRHETEPVTVTSSQLVFAW